MTRVFALLLALFLIVCSLHAQSPLVAVPVSVSDSTGVSAALTFGLDSNATDGLETKLGEQYLPPLPPAGAFDARFILPAGTDASSNDFRKGTPFFNGSVVYEMQFQPSAGSFVQIAWNMPPGVSARMQDEVTGNVVDVPMNAQGNYIVQNAAVVNRLKLTVNYTLDKAVPASPSLLSPANASLNEPVNEIFAWKKVFNAVGYTLQLAKSTSFSTIVFSDSTLTDTVLKVNGLSGSMTYYWRVKALNANGPGNYSSPFMFTTSPTAVRENLNLAPARFALNPNYPNPFNPSTEISYELPAAGFVSIKVYDLLGNQVAQLLNEMKAAGLHTVNFNAQNLKSGVYFAKMEAKTAGKSFIQVRKMLYLK
jgi:hypothetical protein